MKIFELKTIPDIHGKFSVVQNKGKTAEEFFRLMKIG